MNVAQPGPMDHGQAEDLFSAYVDMELGAPDEARLEEHLGTCPSCRQEYEQFARTVSLVRGVEKVRPTPAFSAKVLKRVRRQRRRDIGLQGAGMLMQRFPVEAIVPILLAVAVALLLVVMAP